MRKLWLIIILALTLAMVVLSGCASGTTTAQGGIPSLMGINTQQEGIWVGGTGEVFAPPDMATLRLGIQSQEKTVAEAQSKAADAMDKVMKALSDNGVAKKDIQTQYFNIQRVTRWDKDTGQEVLVGYQVSNIVLAKIRTLDKVGSIIDAVTAAGGDLTRIDSITFSIDEPARYYNDARQKAMADAKAKAEQMAQLADVKLGRPTYISESAQMPPPTPYPILDRAAGAPAPSVQTPISPGEMKITVNVQLIYSIAD